MEAGRGGAGGIYHQTTIETLREFCTTASLAGLKRSHDESDSAQDDTSTLVLADITNRVDFQRPSAGRCSSGALLKASAIHDVVPRPLSEYSQRRVLALTPAPSSNPLLDLSHPAYDLPQVLVNNLASLGVKSIYPWQSECLLGSGALGGERNLVYTAPTGGGKSLVADILMLKKVIKGPRRKAILVLPYVALVQEKLRWLRKVVQGITKNPIASDHKEQRASKWHKHGDENSIRVVGLFGGSRSMESWTEIDIAVCTIQKVWRY